MSKAFKPKKLDQNLVKTSLASDDILDSRFPIHEPVYFDLICTKFKGRGTPRKSTQKVELFSSEV